MSVMIPTMDKIHRVNGGMKYRLVASAMREKIPMSGNTNGDRARWKWDAFVCLMLLPTSNPLYNLNGTNSSIQFHTDIFGPITIVSTSPTLVDTAYGLFTNMFGWQADQNK